MIPTLISTLDQMIEGLASSDHVSASGKCGTEIQTAKGPMAALATYKGNRKDRRWRQCTPEQYLRRRYYVSDECEHMHTAVIRVAHDTYRPPSRKIALKPTLRLPESCSVQTMEIGSTRIQKSRATLNAEVET